MRASLPWAGVDAGTDVWVASDLGFSDSRPEGVSYAPRALGLGAVAPLAVPVRESSGYFSGPQKRGPWYFQGLRRACAAPAVV